MPVIKSAQKQMRQSETRKKRNFATRRKVKAAVKNFQNLILEKKLTEAEKALPGTYKAIDMAAKKNILHHNTAARKKSLLARSLAKK